jgi:pyruvate formate-lyase/glycerol dehydratase family glycyl radical enzyme
MPQTPAKPSEKLVELRPRSGGIPPRVLMGIERLNRTTPELFPFRAVSSTQAFQETKGQPIVLRRVRMLERILEQQPVMIQPGELIVGMKTQAVKGSPVYPEINCAWVQRDLDVLSTRKDTPFFVSDDTKKILRKEVFPYWRGRQVGDRIDEAVPQYIWRADERGVIYNYFRSRSIAHINAGYAKVLKKGMSGIMGDVDKSLARLDHHQPGYLHKVQFLESVARSCQAAVDFAARYAAAARRLAGQEGDPRRKAELLEIARICNKVPLEPAKTLAEALQSFWFTHLVLNLETSGHAFGPGRWDQYLLPYYEHSIESGDLDQDAAQELFDCMWVKFDEITLAKDSGEAQTSSSYPDFQNLNIGGLDRHGHDATNDISYMALSSLERLMLPQPGLSAQISSKTPNKFLVRCAEVLKLGTGMPAMFNSDVMVLGLVAKGKSLADARMSSLNGCVASYCDGKDRMASTGYFNLAKCLELALNNGKDRITGEQLGPMTGDPREFADFERVIQAFREQVAYFVDLKVSYDNRVRDIYATYCPVTFTSAVIDDCIETATDWHAGGSHYKIATMSGVAVGNVADALSGIKKQVFDNRAISMAQMIDALDADFEGHEHLRLLLSNKTPHYGNDDDYADELALLAQDVFCGEVEKHKDVQGAHYYVDLLPTTSHIALGEVTGATPDARRAGSPLSEGLSPVQGHDKKGPTAVAKSVGKLDHARTNGTLLNMKLSPQAVKTQPDLHKLAGLIRSYFDQGGHHVQFNIMDRSILEAAMQSPEKHRNLLVRVAGYSDYFVLLSREIQLEILSRTEHGI